MALAGTTSRELEVDAEGLPLVVDEMAKLAAGAKGWLTICRAFPRSTPHVRMGPAEADDADNLHEQMRENRREIPGGT